MRFVTDSGSLARALNAPIDARLKRLLLDRCKQLDVDDLATAARFLIAEPGDTMPEVERALTFPITGDPPWEWVADHGFCFECLFIFTDDGYAHVLIVVQMDGVDPRLLALCAAYSEPAI